MRCVGREFSVGRSVLDLQGTVLAARYNLVDELDPTPIDYTLRTFEVQLSPRYRQDIALVLLEGTP